MGLCVALVLALDGSRDCPDGTDEDADFMAPILQEATTRQGNISYRYLIAAISL